MSDRQNTTKEQQRIAHIKNWTGEKLIGDDCAVLPGQQLITSDTLVENSHFTVPGIRLADLGWKSMAVNLSDIAAMCGKPRYAVVNLTLPSAFEDHDLERLYSGLVDCAGAYKVRIVGGDLTAGNLIVIGITVVGDCHESGVALRSQAKAGDVVVCTGDFGASAAGLFLMKEGSSRTSYIHCWNKHFRPVPRLQESWTLISASGGRAAAMDASDGLADALVQIGRQSQVGIEVEQRLIPVHQQTQKVAHLARLDVWDWILYGGEDYELIATIAPDRWDTMKRTLSNPFVEIGKVTDEPANIRLNCSDGKSIPLTLEKTFQPWSMQ